MRALMSLAEVILIAGATAKGVGFGFGFAETVPLFGETSITSLCSNFLRGGRPS